GGNISGFTFYESPVLGKMLQILKQIAPGTSRVAIIYNPDNAASTYMLRLSEEFARSIGIEPVLAPFHAIADLEPRARADGQTRQCRSFVHPGPHGLSAP